MLNIRSAMYNVQCTLYALNLYFQYCIIYSVYLHVSHFVSNITLFCIFAHICGFVYLHILAGFLNLHISSVGRVSEPETEHQLHKLHRVADWQRLREEKCWCPCARKMGMKIGGGENLPGWFLSNALWFKSASARMQAAPCTAALLSFLSLELSWSLFILSSCHLWIASYRKSVSSGLPIYSLEDNSWLKLS